jgi:hypothetical protein
MFCLSNLSASSDVFLRCLPDGIKATDIVSAQRVGPNGVLKRITVREKLIELKARCRNRKLVDLSGKEIYLFRRTGCWGNPPANYQEILQRQNAELERLRKRYTVVEMTCNPDGIRLH